jgi:hypothetical protein
MSVSPWAAAIEEAADETAEEPDEEHPASAALRALTNAQMKDRLRALGRDLHSSPYQLNLSRLWSLMPQLPSTSQLNVRRLLTMDLPTYPSRRAHVKPNCGRE